MLGVGGAFHPRLDTRWLASWTATNIGYGAENAGGLQVAIVQLSAAIGAVIGGVALDSAGQRAPVAIAGAALLISTIVVATRVKWSIAPRPASADAGI